MLEDGIVNLIGGYAPLVAAIGSRLYPVVIPEPPTYPCVSYQVVSATSKLATDGTLVQAKRVQFDAYALTYAQCKQIEAMLATLLNGYIGSMGTVEVIATNAGVVIDNWEVDSRIYRVTTEYIFTFTEAPY